MAGTSPAMTETVAASHAALVCGARERLWVRSRIMQRSKIDANQGAVIVGLT